MTRRFSDSVRRLGEVTGTTDALPGVDDATLLSGVRSAVQQGFVPFLPNLDADDVVASLSFTSARGERIEIAAEVPVRLEPSRANAVSDVIERALNQWLAAHSITVSLEVSVSTAFSDVRCPSTDIEITLGAES